LRTGQKKERGQQCGTPVTRCCGSHKSPIDAANN
jgi:hypothetical protein